MAHKLHKFQSLQDLELFLNGGVRGTAGIRTVTPKFVPDMEGKTLVFTAPAAATVTFIAGAAAELKKVSPYGLTFEEIQAQIATQTANAVKAMFLTRQGETQPAMVLVENTPSAGITVGSSSTALALLGLPAEGLTNRVKNVMTGHAAPTAPYIVSIETAQDGCFLLHLMES